MEFYKEVARYRADVQHNRTGEMVDFSAVVYEGPEAGRFYIRYSHTFRPTEGAGFWYSNSSTNAPDPETAETMVRNWAEQLSKSFEVGPWSEI